jgi:hypothetical protein
VACRGVTRSDDGYFGGLRVMEGETEVGGGIWGLGGGRVGGFCGGAEA